jgi:uncharacterized membrane protein YbhN (UPF0104 family)
MSPWDHIHLAVGTGILGIAITFIIILICQYLNINMFEHLWVISIPIVLSLFLNVSVIELYHKIKKKH